MRALLISLILAGGAANAFAGQLPERRSPSSAETQAGKVIVEFRDAGLTDPQLAELVKAIASEVPIESWPEAIVRRDELDIGRLLDRYYDIEARPAIDGALSATAQELTALIERANKVSAGKLTVGQPLKMPPVPVLSLLAAPNDTSVRLYDPASQSYAVVERSGEVRAAFTRGPNESAAVIKDARRSDATAIAMSAEAAGRLEDLGIRNADNLRITVPPNHVRVDLLQADDCPSMDDALRTSPYLERAKARIKEARDRVLDAGRKRRLTLIDFDFESAHGSLVHSAAVWLLDRFDLLDLESSIRKIDLNPSSHVKSARDIPVTLLQPTSDYWAWGKPFGALESSFKDAAGWVLAERPAANLEGYTVPPFLLQSAVWDALARNEWVNLSWRVDASSGALPVELNDLLQKSGAFVTVAAGNERKEVRGDLTPQSAAANSLHFANVTYGVADGRILGSWMSAQGARVDVVANACGFKYRKLAPGTTGSSLASPIVSVAAWLRHLLYGTSADQMRRQLVHAGLLVEPFKGKVVGSGMFDPARLLANVGAHYLNPERTTLTEIVVKELITDRCGTFKPDPERPQDFILSTNDNGDYRLIRRYEVAGELQPRIDVCELSTLALSATTLAGAPLGVKSPEDFEKIIGLLTF